MGKVTTKFKVDTSNVEGNYIGLKDPKTIEYVLEKAGILDEIIFMSKDEIENYNLQDKLDTFSRKVEWKAFQNFLKKYRFDFSGIKIKGNPLVGTFQDCYIKITPKE